MFDPQLYSDTQSVKPVDHDISTLQTFSMCLILLNCYYEDQNTKETSVPFHGSPRTVQRCTSICKILKLRVEPSNLQYRVPSKCLVVLIMLVELRRHFVSMTPLGLLFRSYIYVASSLGRTRPVDVPVNVVIFLEDQA